ncbi:unnamed protein product [Urochloa humidicola]
MEGVGQSRAMARTNGARNRLIAMSGPSSRIPASPVSAIDRALSVADGRVDGSSVFLPRTGTGAARDGFGSGVDGWSVGCFLGCLNRVTRL